MNIKYMRKYVKISALKLVCFSFCVYNELKKKRIYAIFLRVKNMIARPQYLNKLIAKKENGLIKIITGNRRCGKSCLLFTIYHQYLIDNGIKQEQIIELALDETS